MSRVDGRTPAELRSLKFNRNYLTHAEGSCLVQAGGTHVLCAATVEERVPPFLKGKGQGWVTAEYSMLPRSSTERVARDAYVSWQGSRYSVPWQYAGRDVWVQEQAGRIEVLYGAHRIAGDQIRLHRLGPRQV